MPRLSSPDSFIQALLDVHARLHIDLQTYLDENKFVTRKIMPGVWSKFLDSPHGQRWREPAPDQPTCQVCATRLLATDPRPYCRICDDIRQAPEPDALPDLPRPATRTCKDGVCPNLPCCPDCGHCAVHCPGHVPLVQPVVQPVVQPQDELFDLLAKGLQDRLKPATVALGEDRVQAMINLALSAAHRQHQYTIVTRSADDKQLRVTPTDLPMPRWFPRVYKQALCRVHTLLVGPRGCGKTVTGALLAQALDLPLYTISLSAGVSEGVLQGWLHPSKAGLLFEYNRSRFVKAYQEGGVVLLDELDAADANMLMILNAALANGTWEIPLRGETAEALVKHPDFVCLAAANTKGHGADRVYVGRNQLDGATLDRFAMGRLTVDYDEALEVAAYDKATVTFGQRLRARCRAQQGWTRDVSTRNIADACKLQQELSFEESWYSYFEDWEDGECAKVGAVRNRDRMSVALE